MHLSRPTLSSPTSSRLTLPRLTLCLLASAVLSACGSEEQQAQQSQTDISESAQPTAAQLQTEVALANPAATFPAQQRALADAEIIARGETLYGIQCRSCHGQDLRGGDMGGPNILRSDTALNDQAGELLIPLVQNGSSTPGVGEMPAIPLPDNDIAAIAEYIRSVLARGRAQGAPPAGEEVELDILVGNAELGQQFFNQECSGCHSATGDLAGIASTIDSAENLQNSWVAGRRWGAPDPDADPARREVIATVTLSNGDEVRGVLKRRDDFIVALTTNSGTYRSFTLHENTDPGVVSIELDDPLQRHRELLTELTDDMMHNVTAYLVTLK